MLVESFPPAVQNRSLMYDCVRSDPRAPLLLRSFRCRLLVLLLILLMVSLQEYTPAATWYLVPSARLGMAGRPLHSPPLRLNSRLCDGARGPEAGATSLCFGSCLGSWGLAVFVLSQLLPILRFRVWGTDREWLRELLPSSPHAQGCVGPILPTRGQRRHGCFVLYLYIAGPFQTTRAILAALPRLI